MRLRILLLSAALASTSACDNLFDSIADCLGDAIGASISRSSNVRFYEGSRSLDRSDELRTSPQLWISGAHEGGRLVVTFEGPPANGPLPRAFSEMDGGCQSLGDYAWFARPGGELEILSATLVVSEQARTDAGIPTRFSLTGISAKQADGGVRAIASRDLDFVIP